VEHAVTEMVYGVDLVAAQVLTAAGEPLPFDPSGLSPRGHSIEARLYAEDPAQGFLPRTGRVLALQHPEGPGVRVGSSLAEGVDVRVDYDPLLAKVVAWGTDRESATRRLRRALGEFTLLGVPNNLDFLADVLASPAWAAARLHTGFIEEHFGGWSEPAEVPAAAVALALEALSAPTAATNAGSPSPPTPWTALGPWSPLGKA
jgi:acetyl-CoA/propionyl-CoA carboxylase biotin carboxyl carrier protein